MLHVRNAVSCLAGLIACAFAGGCDQARTNSVHAVISATCPTTSAGASQQCTQIDFGAVTLGQTASRGLTLADLGFSTLQITSMTFTPAGGAFQLTDAVTSVKTGAQAPVGIQFAPSELGPTDAVLVIQSNAQNTPKVQIHVLGTGVGPAVATISPATLDFGNVTLGTTEAMNFLVTNGDIVPLQILSAQSTSGSAAFAVEPPPVESVAVGATAQLTATYSPTMIGTDTGIATVEVVRSDALDAPPTLLMIRLQGKSVPVIQVTPPSINFGSQLLGSDTPQSLMISNIGKAPLVVTTVTLGVGTAATITLVAPVPSQVTLQPGGAVGAMVAYQPVRTTSTAADTGSVLIASSDPMTPTVTVPINAQCTNCSGPPPNTCTMTQTCSCGPRMTCSGTSCIPARRVFVSEATTTGNLGGVSGADTLCNSYATAAELGGTWRAFLGDSTTAPETWTTPSSVPYALIDGTIVASDWTHFLSGSLAHGIDLNECQLPISNAEVWTGLFDLTSTTGSGCSDFTSGANSAPYASVGLTDNTDSGWYDVYLQFCDRSNVRLYCIEQ
jgi:hypothetical protein